MNITNKTILISGAASGMGAATARYLAEQGAKIILLDIDEKAAQAVANDVDGLAIACNVTDASSVEAAVSKAVKQFSELHVAISCAGIAPAARIVGREGAMPLADFDRVIQINLIGTFNVMRVCAAQMSRQAVQADDGERGVIINTASVAAYEGQVGQAAYSASKGGVVSMTLPAARELAQHGIRVTTVAPGIMSTPMMAAMPDKVQQSLQANIPFPKRLGDANEYAQLVAEIIQNRYLNGSVIRLDAATRLA